MKVNELSKYTDQDIINEFLSRIDMSEEDKENVGCVMRILTDMNHDVWRIIDNLEYKTVNDLHPVETDTHSQATVTMPLHEYEKLKNEHDERMKYVDEAKNGVRHTLNQLRGYTFQMYQYIKDLKSELDYYHTRFGTQREIYLSELNAKNVKSTQKSFFKRLFNKWED